jgi:hypothetical protein
MDYFEIPYVKYREGILLNERGKYSISYARWKECDKMTATQIASKLPSEKFPRILHKQKREARSVAVKPYTSTHCYSSQLGSGG